MISVCMAVCDGATFVEAQLQSILGQLGAADEVIVVDDASTDNSAALVAAFRDPRIRLLCRSQRAGVLRSFESALREARGEWIFLADQDDIWLPGKVETVIAAFRRTGALAVLSDAVVIDQGGATLQPSYFAWRGSRPGVLRNFYKSAFLGCCMALRQECRSFLLPFPRLTYMHDQWVGLACSIVGRVHFLPQPLVAYRRHAGNLTQMRRSPWPWIAWRRLLLLLSLLGVLPRLLGWRRRRALTGSP